MQFSISCELPLSARDMWRIRASAAFRRHVVEGGLLKKLDSSVPRPAKDGYQARTQRYVPAKVECPDFLRKIIGDALFDVTDEQRWKDDDAFEQLFSIRPTHLSAFCCTEGTLTITPAAASGSVRAPSLSDDTDLDGVSSDESEAEREDAEEDVEAISPSPFAALPLAERCVHTIAGTTKVNLPGAGWAVERAIVHNLRTFYECYPTCVATFRKTLHDKFANGDEGVATSVVVDRLLKHEEETESVSSDDTSESDPEATPSEIIINVPFDPSPRKTNDCPIEAELEKFFV